MARDPDGNIWFGTLRGVVRYHAGQFQGALKAKGLIRIELAVDGTLWVSPGDGNLFHYQPDSGRSTAFVRMADTKSPIQLMRCSPDGAIWMGSRRDGTLYRYHEASLDTFRLSNQSVISAIHPVSDCEVWLGTPTGIYHLRFSDPRKLDSPEHLRFFPKQDDVNSIAADDDGVLWFGMEKNVLGYDGVAWTSLSAVDGLLASEVLTVEGVPMGGMWFGTAAGVTHYRKSHARPRVHIISVRTDKTYTDFSTLPNIIAGTQATISYNDIDFKTDPRRRQYRVRIGIKQVAHLVKGSDVKALVVDDVPGNRDVLAQILSEIGARVTTAEHGQQALERAGVSY